MSTGCVSCGMDGAGMTAAQLQILTELHPQLRGDIEHVCCAEYLPDLRNVAAHGLADTSG